MMKPTIQSMADYEKAYQESVENPEKFWADIASHFSWNKQWDQVLNWSFDDFKVEWFKGAKLNITENCLDRHLPLRAHDTAIIWESNNPAIASRCINYQQLYHEVCRTANMLKKLGVKKGDRVCIYLPMIPEATIAMLACARIGAIHSVVFAGFSAISLTDRINDSSCKVVLTSYGAFRGAKSIALNEIVDEALINCS
jgi:acetyl-CoA synthetase